MKEINLTEAQVQELEELNRSEFVKLARREARLAYKKRQRLYQLRNLEKRGKELAAAGITLENIEAQIIALETDDLTEE